MKTKKRDFPNPIPANACAPCAAKKYGWTAYWVRPNTMCYHHHREWLSLIVSKPRLAEGRG